eukprot:6193135-Pleurochrysis_carterae.AAC.2
MGLRGALSCCSCVLDAEEPSQRQPSVRALHTRSRTLRHGVWPDEGHLGRRRVTVLRHSCTSYA